MNNLKKWGLGIIFPLPHCMFLPHVLNLALGEKSVVNKISKKGLSLNLRGSKGSGSSFDSRFWLEKKKVLE